LQLHRETPKTKTTTINGKGKPKSKKAHGKEMAKEKQTNVASTQRGQRRSGALKTHLEESS